MQEREVPVELGGKDFHIDGILCFPTVDRGARRFVVVECKRTDPKYSEWIFARSTSDSRREFISDKFWVPNRPGDSLRANAIRIRLEQRLGYDFASERKLNDAKGNGVGRKLDEALAQVFRGVGGLAHLLPEWTEPKTPSVIVPLIITTGALIVVDEALETADLASGDMDTVTSKAVDWLWLTTNVSRSLMPRVAPRRDAGPWGSFGRRMAHESRRGVVVANVTGIVPALQAIAANTEYLDDLVP